MADNYAIMFGLGLREEGKPSLPNSLMLLVKRADSLEDAINSQQDLYGERDRDFSHPIAFRRVDSVTGFIIQMHEKYDGRYGTQPNPRESDLWFDGDNITKGELLVQEQSFNLID